MKTVQTESRTKHRALCDPIILRESARRRLVFIPSIVDHSSNSAARVEGTFVYQRKAASENWVPVQTVAVTTLKAGEGFHLALEANELAMLVKELSQIYEIGAQPGGVPQGKKTFVQFDTKALGNLRELDPSNESLEGFLSMTIPLLLKALVRREAPQELASMPVEELTSFSSLLGLSTLKSTLKYWKDNKSNPSEKFWQETLSQRTYVLSQLFAYPVLFVGEQMYVGGKALSNQGGKVIDFLPAIESTGALVIIEIKTPGTPLLHPTPYRIGVYQPSTPLTGAVSQALRCQQTLMKSFDTLTAENDQRPTLGHPRCIVIAGNSSELTSHPMKENFELYRDSIRGLTIVTYDELFARLEKLIALLEGQ